MNAYFKLSLRILLQLTLFASIEGSSPSRVKQQRSSKELPDTIRGYKVEKARVLVKKPVPSPGQNGADTGSDSSDAIVQLGDFNVARITPLGITLELPVTVSAVKQGGHVDFLTFEDVVVNGTTVSIDDYYHPFELSTKEAAALPVPIRVYISSPGVVLGAIDEWNDSKQTWKVSARIYVFGRYKKFLLKFKRVVPVELEFEIPNPIRGKGPPERKTTTQRGNDPRYYACRDRSSMRSVWGSEPSWKMCEPVSRKPHLR
jgi:hypothetical protein